MSLGVFAFLCATHRLRYDACYEGEEMLSTSTQMTRGGCPMMDMAGMSWMMGGGIVIGLLIIVLLVLAIAALVKYLKRS